MAYLDAASGAPLHPVAREALVAALGDGWADPGRLYSAGRRAALLLDAARELTAECLGARPDEVSFPANGTQAVHTAVLGLLRSRAGATFVHTAVEHSAILHAADQHAARGGQAVSIGVDAHGRVDPIEFAAAAEESTAAAAAVQAANHEVGTTQPVTRIADLVPEVPLVVDVMQTLGHAPIPRGWSGRRRRAGDPDRCSLGVTVATRRPRRRPGAGRSQRRGDRGGGGQPPGRHPGPTG